MNWNTISSHVGRNWKNYVPLAIFFLAMLWYAFSKDPGFISTEKIPGGGLATLLIAAAAGWAANRSNNKWLWIITYILLIVWAWPRMVPVADQVGMNPTFIAKFITPALFILAGMIFWIWRRRNGFLWWRSIFAILLVLSIFQPSKYLLSGWDEAKKSGQVFGISIPSVSTPKPLKKLWAGLKRRANGGSEKFLAESEQDEAKNFASANQARTVLIKESTLIYNCQNDDCIALRYAFKDEEVLARIGGKEIKLNNGLLIQVFLPASGKRNGDLYAKAIEAYVPANQVQPVQVTNQINRLSTELAQQKRATQEAQVEALEAKNRAKKITTLTKKFHRREPSFKRKIRAGSRQNQDLEKKVLELAYYKQVGFLRTYHLPPNLESGNRIKILSKLTGISSITAGKNIGVPPNGIVNSGSSILYSGGDKELVFRASSFNYNDPLKIVIERR